jgi:hypothetical protein
MCFTNRRGLLSLAFVLMVHASAPDAAWAQTPKSAPSLAEASAIRAGEEAMVARKWSEAEAAFAAAWKLARSERALFGLASAEYELGLTGKAYEHFEEYLSAYGNKVAPARKLVASKKLADLVQKTGLIAINVSVAGADILIDEVAVGISPLSKPLRVSGGPHRVTVRKGETQPWSQTPNVSEGGFVTLVVDLGTATTKGHLVITEANGKATQVVLDGAEVGPTPWEGDVEAGVHELALRGLGLASETEKIDLPRGGKRELKLTASGGPATLKVATSDGLGSIAIDGRAVGEGTVTESLAAGEHSLRVTRDGYQPLEKTVTLKPKEMLSETLTLRLLEKITTDSVEEKVRGLEGVYGALNIAGVLSPSGLGSTAAALCNAGAGLGAENCVGGTPLGGELGGHVGYHWNPIGLELALAVRYDHTADSANFNGIGDPTSNRLAVGVARKEVYDVYRAGASAAIRSRFAVQSKKFRFSAAAGAGFSYRKMYLARKSEATDGTGRADTFAPEARSYASPMLSFDAGLSYRTSEAFALRLGLSLSVENATLFSSDSARTDADPNRYLGATGQVPVAVVTPSYFLATSGQINTGLYVGIEFGP